MRLIDADALMETIRSHDYPLRDYFNSTGRGMYTVGIQQAVEEQQTIDAVEVVRCRECKWWDVDSNGIFCEYGRVPKDDWFCADGEVKKDEQTI